jgi:serine/threonine protein kinase
MPIATRLDEYLGPDSSLDEIVLAMRQISETLARCAERGIFHRDIKPANLYWFNGRSVIGDFGLVYLPNRQALTESGRKFGPLFFLPDEMLNDASSAEPGPADVFMLAKTLWVLATGQNYPPQGEIRTANKQVRLSGYWNEPKAHLLDELVARCTNVNPNDRPTMKEVAEELSAWLAYDAVKVSPAPDLLDIGAKLKPLISAHRANFTSNTRRKKECERLREEIGVLLQPLANQITQQTNLHAEVTRDNHINSVIRHPDKYNKGGAFGPSVNVVAKVASDHMACGFLACGVGLMVADDVPTISLFSAHAIRGNNERLLWSRQAEIVPNSAREKQVVAELIDELYKSLRDALNDYAEHLANTEPNI